MSAHQGFTAVPQTLDAPEIGVGMLGYAFMGRAHSNALIKLPHMIVPPPMVPKLVALCGRNEQAVATTARRFGYAGYYTDWRDRSLAVPKKAGPCSTP
jgi:predicted dehydrogenase